MKKLFTSLKFLLVAVCLLGGGNSAWAEAGDVTVNANIDFSNAIVEGTVAGSVNSMAVGAGEIVDGWLRLYDGTSTITIPSAQRAGSRDVVKISFNMAWGNKNSMGSGFRIKDAEGTSLASFQYARWDGSSANSNTFGIDNIYDYMAAHYNNTPITARYTKFDITIDYAANSVSTIVSCPYSGASKTFSSSLSESEPIASIEFYGYGVGGNQDRASVIDDIYISTTEGDYSIATADYTVNWKLGSDVVKTATRNGEIDASVTLLSADKDAFVVAGQRYFYVSDDASANTIAGDGSTVVTINVRKANVYSYSVKAYKDSEELTTIVSGSYTEGDAAIETYYPRLILVGNTLYSSGTGSVTYSTTYTPDVDNYVKQIAYNNAEATNVAFYTEAEDVAGITVAGNNKARASNGLMGYTASKDTYQGVTTLAPGKYVIYMRGQNGNKDARNFNFKVGDDVVFTGSIENGTNKDANSAEFTVSTSSTLSFASEGSSSSGVDYFYVMANSVSATIGATGWTTFASPLALDLSSLSGTAYYASAVNTTSVTMTETAQAAVAAGEGIMLKGNAGDVISIPVVATGTAISGNKLVGCTAETVLPVNANYYVLVNNGGTAEFQSLEENGATIPAGKAYLDATSAGARSLDIVFGDADGITAIDNAQSTGNAMFDLSGRRVAKAQKGIYIVNGKKVVK